MNDDPIAAAQDAGLRYVSDTSPGIRRVRDRDFFQYHNSKGDPIDDERTLDRIRALAIPPAWTDVWIAPSPRAHLQATGRDAKGRKQYRYHERRRATRDATKYDRMLAFSRALPAIRERVQLDLNSRGLGRERVLAAIVALLDRTHIRVGNEEYARENNSYGLTTLRNWHVAIEGSTLEFRFRGKSGKEHAIGLSDRRLARIIQRLQDLPGQELFQYEEEGELHTVDSSDVNDYLREMSGDEFTAKDFRTWAGTVQAAEQLAVAELAETESARKRTVAEAIKLVAARLGNTPAVCRKCYVHPAILTAFDSGALREAMEHVAPIPGLQPNEAVAVAILKAEG